MLKKYIWRIFNSIAKRGLFNTISFILDDFIFKYRYKLNTGGIIELKELTVEGNPEFGTPYQGVNSRIFNATFHQLDIAYENSTFVDLGCGKGKSLVLAAEKGFQNIIGVEFAGELVEICKSNIKRIKPKFPKIKFQIIHFDASKYKFTAETNIVFFNNPFNCAELTDEMLNNLEHSLKDFPRDIYLLYFTPIYSDCLRDRPFELIFEKKAKQKSEVKVYKYVL